MKHVLLFTLLLGAVTLQAQDSETDKRTIPKGTWNIGGDFSLGISDSTTDYQFDNNEFERESDRFSISIYPRIGYAFAENWMAGLRAGYSLSSIKNENSSLDEGIVNSEGKGESFEVAPYVRRYFGLTNDLMLFVQGEIGYSRSWSEDVGDNSERQTSNGRQYFAAFRPGLSFFLTNKLALESSIGALRYFSTKRESSTGSKNTDQGFDLSLDSSNLFFGLSYYF